MWWGEDVTPWCCRRQKEKRVTPDSQLGQVSPLSCYSQPASSLFSPGQGAKLTFPYDHLAVKSEGDWEGGPSPLLWRLLLYIPPPPTRTFITKGKKPKSQMIKTCDGPGVSGASWLFFLDLSQPEYLDWWWLYNIQFLLKRAIRYLVPNFIIKNCLRMENVNKCSDYFIFPVNRRLGVIRRKWRPTPKL